MTSVSRVIKMSCLAHVRFEIRRLTWIPTPFWGGLRGSQHFRCSPGLKLLSGCEFCPLFCLWAFPEDPEPCIFPYRLRSPHMHTHQSWLQTWEDGNPLSCVFVLFKKFFILYWSMVNSLHCVQFSSVQSLSHVGLCVSSRYTAKLLVIYLFLFSFPI